MKIAKNILFFPDKEVCNANNSKSEKYEEKDDKANLTDKNYNSDAKLRMRIRWNKQTINFNVGHRVFLDKWSTDTQRCNKNTTNKKKESASQINNKIQAYEDAANEVFKKFETSNTIPTIDQYRIAFNNQIGRNKKPLTKGHDFFSYFDQFTKERGNLNDWTDATYEKFETVKNHLESYDTELTFEKLSEDGLTNYVQYLRNDKELRNTTIEKQLGFLKWFLRWAKDKEYNKQLAFEKFTPKLKKANKTIIFLEWDELMILYNKEIPEDKKHLERVRDVFCFCCFSSLRYSDVENLKRSSVYKTHIKVTTIKTDDSLEIDLNDYSRAILEKYKDIELLNNSALPVISNQKMNDYLKDVAAFCELDRPITQTYYKGNKRTDEVNPLHKVISSHSGRKTFISNALMLGIPAEVVMKWTGHADYKSMKPYIAIADKEKAKQMDLFNKR